MRWLFFRRKVRASVLRISRPAPACVTSLPAVACVSAIALLILGSTATRAEEKAPFRVGPGPSRMSAEEKDLKADPAAGMQHALILVEETERDDPIEGYAKTSYHLRAKIFSNEARALADVVIPMDSKRGYLKEWWGRVLLPDGTVREVNKDDLKEATIVEVSGLEAKVQKAALPGVEPGSVLDYGYVIQDRSWEWVRDIVLQRRWPIRLFRYRWLPAQDYPSQYFVNKRPGVEIKVTSEKLGVLMEGKDLPAAPDEPYMPSATTVRANVTLYYHGFFGGTSTPDPNSFWDEVARREESEAKAFVRKEAPIQEAIASMKFPDGASLLDRLRLAYEWVGANVKNTFLMTSEEQETEEKKESRHERTSEDVLREKSGSGWEIDRLFIGIARQLGAEAFVVRAPDRSVRYWDRGLQSAGQLSEGLIRIRAPGDPEEKAFYLDPGDGYPFGVIPWRAAPSKALLATAEGAKETVIKVSDPRQNVLETKVSLAFEGDGTSAQVRWSSHGTGQRGFYDRRSLRWKDPEKRKERLSGLCGNSGTLEISKAESPGLDNPVGEFRLECEGDLSTPDVGGDRAEAHVGLEGPWLHDVPALEAAPRSFPIVFDYPWMDLTSLDIAAPGGFAPVEAPQPIRIDSPFGSYALKVSATPNGYHADRAFAMVGATWKAEANEPLRKFLEDVRVADRTKLGFRKTSEVSR